MPNGCQNSRPSWRLTSSPAVRAPVYKTAALPTELHRRETRCMVAHRGDDVLGLVLTCTSAARRLAPPQLVGARGSPCGEVGGLQPGRLAASGGGGDDRRAELAGAGVFCEAEDEPG